MEKQDSTTLEQLRSYAKDEQAYESLKKMFTEIVNEKDRYKRELSLLESAIKNDYDAILITELSLESPGPRIVYVNPGFTEMTGYTREEVIGKTPRILQGPKTDQETLDQLKQALKEGKSFFGQTVNYRKDGSEFINQWDIHPLEDEDGNITHWVSYQHDITERKRAEEAILERDVDTDDLYESSKKTIVDFDDESRILYANKAFREMVGYGKEELKRMKIWDLIPEKQRHTLAGEFKKLWEEESAAGNTYRILLTRKNGMPIQVEIAVRLMKADERTVLRAEINNISLRKKVLKTLEKKSSEFGNVLSGDVDFKYGLKLKEDQPGFEWISEDIEKVTGFSVDECLGSKGWKKLIHPEDQEFALRHLQKAHEGKSSCEEYRIMTRSGEPVKVVDYAKPDEEDPGCVKGVVSEASKNVNIQH